MTMPDTDSHAAPAEHRTAVEENTRFTAVNSTNTTGSASTNTNGSTIVVGNNRLSTGSAAPSVPAVNKVVSAVEDWQDNSEPLPSHKRKRTPEPGQLIQSPSPQIIAAAAQGNIIAPSTPASALMQSHTSPHPPAPGSVSGSIIGGDEEMGGLGDDNFSERGHNEDDKAHFAGIRGAEESPQTPGNEGGEKKRKRQFANRTKTGCITCRRRKKKCDEGKPECINCKRGGFVCEGYTTKVSWPKAQSKAATPVSIQSKIEGADASASPSPAGQASTHFYVAGEQPLMNAQPTSLIEEHARVIGQPLPSGPLIPFPAGHVVPAVGTDSEKFKMLNGQTFYASSPELVVERDRCKAACYQFNNAVMMNASKSEQWRKFVEILRPGGQYEGMPTPVVTEVDVETPFHCTYGTNITIGREVKIGSGCNIDDASQVTIKDRTIIDQDVKIYTSLRATDPRKRQGGKGPEYAKPVVIEEDCWIGGNVTILPGVTISRGAVVGSGSVVSKEVPPYTIVAGNPATVLRGIYANGADT